MNVMKKELKYGAKVFLFWTAVMMALILGGMVKFTGLQASAQDNISKMMDSFPKVFLAMFGMNGIDMQTLAGYYSILQAYVLICVGIYAVFLGVKSVTGEAANKTYDFLFTKPISTTMILLQKLIASVIYILLFAVVNLVLSVVSLKAYGIENTIMDIIMFYTIVTFLVGFLFLCVGTFVSTLVKNPKKSENISMGIFFVSYILGVVYDLFENANIIRYVSPFKWFLPNDLINGNMDFQYALPMIVFSLVLLAVSLKKEAFKLPIFVRK